MVALVDVLGLDVDAQGHITAGLAGEAVLDAPQITGHQGEQVSRLHERVFPGRPVATIVCRPATDRVAVRQQYRVAMLFGDDRGGEGAHHVRAVEVVGDLAEAFGLALGAEHLARLVQAFQCGVALGVDLHAGVEGEALGLGLHGQAVGIELVVARLQLLVIQRGAQQFQLLAIELQWRQAGTACRVAAHDQLRVDQGVVLEQLEGQVRLVDQVLGRLVILEVDHLRLFGTHVQVLFTGARPTGRPCTCEY